MVILLASPNASVAMMNVINKCWRENPNWRNHQQQLAMCSVGFVGKMTNNIGKSVIRYKVTDPSDDPLNPKLGTLRHGATMIKGIVWITFKRNIHITLRRPLLIRSFTAIDGRGVDVHITSTGCLLVYQATNVIIHGLSIHHCKSQPPSFVMGPDSKLITLGQMDGDAIKLGTTRKVWIDHNTLNQDKAVLLGHDDGHLRDGNMMATIIFNHFRPNCNQRMPRVRHGLVHVANNLYQGWEQYAIGGSMSPSIKSQANFFFAPKLGNKEVTWRQSSHADKASWKFYSMGDVFENGASFNTQTGLGGAKPNYYHE
ncbi:hypothetical protein PTKIN_Ptkin11bG0086200 [Pterospermum kingtungense]